MSKIDTAYCSWYVSNGWRYIYVENLALYMYTILYIEMV